MNIKDRYRNYDWKPINMPSVGTGGLLGYIQPFNSSECQG